MANMIIKPAADGNLLIQDRAGGAVLSTSTSGATIANATLTTCTFPAGHIIQVVSGGTTTETVVTGGFTATNLQATITPTATSSKVLILATPQIASRNASGNDSQAGLLIYSNAGAGGAGSSTFAAISTEERHRAYDYGGSGLNVNVSSAVNWLDSPSLAAAIIYKLYIRLHSGTDVRLNDGGYSGIVLMEVAG